MKKNTQPKNFVSYQETTKEDLIKVSGGSTQQPSSLTITIKVSLAMCPTTRCASIVRSCRGGGH